MERKEGTREVMETYGLSQKEIDGLFEALQPEGDMPKDEADRLLVEAMLKMGLDPNGVEEAYADDRHVSILSYSKQGKKETRNFVPSMEAREAFLQKKGEKERAYEEREAKRVAREEELWPAFLAAMIPRAGEGRFSIAEIEGKARDFVSEVICGGEEPEGELLVNWADEEEGRIRVTWEKEGSVYNIVEYTIR